MLMAVFCLGASLIGINAQEKDWANLQRYAQQNAELPKPDKNEKRVVFMGNSIILISLNPTVTSAGASADRLLTSSWYVSGKMSSTYLLHW